MKVIGWLNCLSVLKLFNLLVWCLGDTSLILLGIYFIWGVVTALVSRIVLNLRIVRDPCGHDELAPLSRVGCHMTERSGLLATPGGRHITSYP